MSCLLRSNLEASKEDNELSVEVNKLLLLLDTNYQLGLYSQKGNKSLITLVKETIDTINLNHNY
jgi:hypothetical protein